MLRVKTLKQLFNYVVLMILFVFLIEPAGKLNCREKYK